MNKFYVNLEDKYRAILTETTPFETPIIFSNDGLYILLKNKIYETNSSYKKIFESIIYNKSEKTKPYKYYIPKGLVDTRIISLIHPSAQVRLSEFLSKYSELVLYHCTKSISSLRYPYKLTSNYYLKDKEINNIYKYKSEDKSISEYDSYSLYSPSFFSYKDFQRIYKFINSSLFMNLELSFKLLRTIDISKCFNNIYTHSISWSAKNKKFIKSNLKRKSINFANEFDKHIRYGNYDETHGIPIGPEISRVFAEIILQRIDVNIITALKSKYHITYDVDYTFKRYIDDIYLFCNNPDIMDKICKEIAYEYSLYNLYLNQNKVKDYTRPFITSKSICLEKISDLISSFTEKIMRSNIYNTISFKNRIFNKIKSIIKEEGLDYSEISSFIIGSISRRIKRYIKENESSSSIRYDIVNLFFDISFFMLILGGNSACTNIICNDIIYIIEKNLPNNRIYLNWYENINNFIHKIKSNNRSSLEVINMMLITKAFPECFQFSPKYVRDVLLSSELPNYFNLVSSLFYIEDKSVCITKEIVKKIEMKIESEKDEFSSELHHLILDIISCPYINREDKKHLYRISNLEKYSSVSDCSLGRSFFNFAEKNHVFINWRKFSMHHFLFKKELQKRMLKQVY